MNRYDISIEHVFAREAKDVVRSAETAAQAIEKLANQYGWTLNKSAMGPFTSYDGTVKQDSCIAHTGNDKDMLVLIATRREDE